MLKDILKRLRPVDTIILVYSLLMLILNLLFGYRLNCQLTNVMVYIACILFSVVFITLRAKYNTPIMKFLSNLYPIILLIAYYEVSGFQIHIFFNGFYDSILLNIENALFTVHPTVWLQQFNHPLFTEWMMFGYSAYLLLLPFTVGWLFIKGMQKESGHLLLSLIISFFICYIVFILLPVEGPRFVLADQYTVTFKGYFFINIVELLENEAMLHGGAFPSAHCSAATVMLILSYKYDKKLHFLILPIIITLYISTMYGRYHYPLDVFAGIIAGIAGINLSYPIEKLWGKITSHFS